MKLFLKMSLYFLWQKLNAITHRNRGKHRANNEHKYKWIHFVFPENLLLINFSDTQTECIFKSQTVVLFSCCDKYESSSKTDAISPII